MDPNLTGAGPWTEENPLLGPGDAWRMDLERAKNGKYRRFTPMDSVLIKNYNADNRIDVEINGIYSVDIDPSGKDSYSDTAIRVFKVVNRGSTEIAEGDVTMSFQSEPYDADDQALEDRMRGPLSSIVKNQFGIEL